MRDQRKRNHLDASVAGRESAENTRACSKIGLNLLAHGRKFHRARSLCQIDFRHSRKDAPAR
jgi:hypothetical protein